MSRTKPCRSCGRPISVFNMTLSGLCGECARGEPAKIAERVANDRQAAETDFADRIRDGLPIDWATVPIDLVAPYASMVPISTTLEIAGHRVVQTCTVISAETALGMNVFRDLANVIRDAVGGRSITLQKALRVNRETCLTELRREALIAGGNAIVGIDLDYSEFSSSAVSGGMLMTVATGTAVVVEPIPPTEAILTR